MAHKHELEESNFEITSKRRKGFPSETQVKRGVLRYRSWAMSPSQLMVRPEQCGHMTHGALCKGRARLIRSRSFGVFITSQRSLRRCTLSQNSGLLPNTRARIRAVAAVTFLRLPHSSLTCLR